MKLWPTRYENKQTQKPYKEWVRALGYDLIRLTDLEEIISVYRIADSFRNVTRQRKD